ncbi:MAG: class I SAM-dependent methyltransferase [Vicinamibacterales bacterium]|nr:class I SAM-dependent methyltransferase [Vicinamibacterales bacterium]
MMHDTTKPAAASASPAESACHVCPWWLGPILASPLRRLVESPERLLQPLVTQGMTVLEPGCGMGFFTIPLGRLVGPGGKVVAVDVQPRMIDGLRRRARRAGVADRVHTIVSSPGDAGLTAFADSADLAVVIHVLHEVPDQYALLCQVYAALRPGGLLLIVEPKGHVTQAEFEATIERARRAGFRDTDREAGWRGLSVVLEKSGGGAG